MRSLLTAALLMIGAPVCAQTPSPDAAATRECWPSSHIDHVVVQMTDGTTKRGVLLCLGPTDFTLAERYAVGRYSLGEVRRLRKAADPVWDGFLKGAAVGLIPLILCHGGCPADFLVRSTFAYGAVGLAMDAADTHMDVIYRPSAGNRIAVGFRVPL